MPEVIMNKLMVNLLRKMDQISFDEKSMELKINKIFNEYFSKMVSIDNCILLRGNDEKLNKKYIIKTYGSFSAFEDSENHVHISDIINCKLIETLKYGILIKELLKNKLIKKFNNKFIIILTCDGKRKINTILRFYKYRKNEIELYNQNLINSYDTCKYKTGFIVEKI